MRSIHKFLRLSAADRSLLIASLVDVIYVRLCLCFISHRHLLRSPQASHAPRASHQQIARSVARAARLVPYASCLTRALAGHRRLASQGEASSVRIGVALDANARFVAHAWLVCGEEVLLGGSQQQLDRYTLLTEFSARAA